MQTHQHFLQCQHGNCSVLQEGPLPNGFALFVAMCDSGPGYMKAFFHSSLSSIWVVYPNSSETKLASRIASICLKFF